MILRLHSRKKEQQQALILPVLCCKEERGQIVGHHYFRASNYAYVQSLVLSECVSEQIAIKGLLAIRLAYTSAVAQQQRYRHMGTRPPALLFEHENDK